jgi:crotonobetainyl-CoA:carnitine CoA-transferase CaiB-like acyl-CoA transferase
MAAQMMAFGVSSALLRRERTGRGGCVDVTLMQAAMTLANNQLIRSEDRDRAVHLRQLARLRELRAQGAGFAAQAAVTSPARALPLRAVYFRTFASADGTLAIAAASRGLQERFCRVLGVEDRGLAASDTWTEEWSDHYLALGAEVEAVMRTQPSDHWLALLHRSGVPASTVLFPVELFEDPQAIANDMFQLIDHPTAGRIRALSPPIGMDGEGFRATPPTPAFGSESRALLSELGFDEPGIQRLLDAGITRETMD